MGVTYRRVYTVVFQGTPSANGIQMQMHLQLLGPVTLIFAR